MAHSLMAFLEETSIVVPCVKGGVGAIEAIDVRDEEIYVPSLPVKSSCSSLPARRLRLVNVPLVSIGKRFSLKSQLKHKRSPPSTIRRSLIHLGGLSVNMSQTIASFVR